MWKRSYRVQAAASSTADSRRPIPSRIEASAPKYQNLPGLIRKYYLRAEDGRTAGGVYLWESRAAAEAAYSPEWREHVAKLFGGAPEIAWFDTPVIVDNAALASKAA